MTNKQLSPEDIKKAIKRWRGNNPEIIRYFKQRVIEDSPFLQFRNRCKYRLSKSIDKRPVNGLNIEIGSYSDRCSLKTPDHWPESATAARWLLSGGDIFVFGLCQKSSCGLGHKWCSTCGHREESHDIICKPSGCNVEDCNCDNFNNLERKLK